MIPLDRKFLIQMKKDSSVITTVGEYTAIEKTEKSCKLIVLPTRSLIIQTIERIITRCLIFANITVLHSKFPG